MTIKITDEADHHLNQLMYFLRCAVSAHENFDLATRFPNEQFPEETVPYVYLCLTSKEFASDQQSEKEIWARETFDLLGWNGEVGKVSSPVLWKHVEKDALRQVQFAYEKRRQNPRRNIVCYWDQHDHVLSLLPEGVQDFLRTVYEIRPLEALWEEGARKEENLILERMCATDNPLHWYSD